MERDAVRLGVGLLSSRDDAHLVDSLGRQRLDLPGLSLPRTRRIQPRRARPDPGERRQRRPPRRLQWLKPRPLRTPHPAAPRRQPGDARDSWGGGTAEPGAPRSFARHRARPGTLRRSARHQRRPGDHRTSRAPGHRTEPTASTTWSRSARSTTSPSSASSRASWPRSASTETPPSTRRGATRTSRTTPGHPEQHARHGDLRQDGHAQQPRPAVLHQLRRQLPARLDGFSLPSDAFATWRRWSASTRRRASAPIRAASPRRAMPISGRPSPTSTTSAPPASST